MTGQVSRMEGYTPDSQMGTVGYVVAAGAALLLLPVLPFVAVVWLAVELGEGDERSDAHRQ